MSAAPAPKPRSFLSPFRHALFRNIWIFNLISTFGATTQMVAAAWLMTEISQSPTYVTLVQGSVSAALLGLSLWAGALADLYSRRRILLLTQFFLMGISISLVLTLWMGWLTPELLLLFTFLIGCGAAVRIPAWQASVREFVPKEDLPGAIALNSVSFNLARSFAPALGGLIVATFGAIAAFAFNAMSYIGLIVVFRAWCEQRPKASLPPEGIPSAMGAGLRYVAMSPNILHICLRGFAFGFGAIVFLAMTPLVARELIGGGVRSYGVLLGALGAGGVLAAMVNAWLRTRFEGETILKCGFLLTAVTIAVLGWSRHLWLSCFFMALGGAAWVWVFTLLNVAAQYSAPRWVLARVLAIYQATSAAGFVLGSWVSGSIAGAFGTQTAMVTFALVLVGGAFLGRLWPVPEPRELNFTPLNPWTPPPLGLDLEPNSGPIMIWAQYVIKEENLPEFLDIMEQRRRVRVRDGARHWKLQRGLEEPERWTMSYQFPTWVEYVRHNQRTTEADGWVSKRLRALHAGSEPPVLQRMIERQAGASRPSQEEKPSGEFVH